MSAPTTSISTMDSRTFALASGAAGVGAGVGAGVSGSVVSTSFSGSGSCSGSGTGSGSGFLPFPLPATPPFGCVGAVLATGSFFGGVSFFFVVDFVVAVVDFFDFVVVAVVDAVVVDVVVVDVVVVDVVVFSQEMILLRGLCGRL